MSESPPNLDDIRRAQALIAPAIRRTPVLTSHAVDEISGARLFFKCENFQTVGAFKFRGACHAVFNLTAAELAHGVATHSSGNHAAALAHAAALRGARAHIVMPRNSPRIKQEAVAGYGGDITWCEPTLAAREATLAEVTARTGATFIHPYDNPHVIYGQGTAALELLEDFPDLDAVIAPVGGGGLLSGTATAAKGWRPEIQVFGAEPAGADDACRSFHSGRLIPVEHPQTIADGLRTSLSPRTFAIISAKAADILTASEEGIVRAMRLVWERMKIIIEPSSAVPLAAILEHREAFADKKVGVIVSGGNVDLTALPF